MKRLQLLERKKTITRIYVLQTHPRVTRSFQRRAIDLVAKFSASCARGLRVIY